MGVWSSFSVQRWLAAAVFCQGVVVESSAAMRWAGVFSIFALPELASVHYCDVNKSSNLAEQRLK